jgi:hypothetical protein
MVAIIPSSMLIPFILVNMMVLAIISFWLTNYIPWYLAYWFFSAANGAILLEIMWFRAQRYIE